MILRSLKLSNWRQFENVDIAFHPRLTILTGANGAGKTTLLSIIGQLYGWTSIFVSTRRSAKSGILSYFSGLWRSITDSQAPSQSTAIGNIQFQNGHTAQIAIPGGNGAVFQVQILNPQPISGLNIPSHRPIYNHQPVNSIPTAPKTKNELFSQYHGVVRSRYFNQISNIGPSHSLKEALISLAMFGIGNEVVEGNPAAKKLYEDFEAILRIVLPASMGFKQFAIRMPEVNFLTESGEFSLDAVSGGTASIIDITWQIFTFAPDDGPFVVTFDEPENHLHPELQARLLPNLIRAFPNAQFIIATHNPLIISSEPDSSIFALSYNEDRRVVSQVLDLTDKAGSANDILTNVLGLPYTMPIWAATRLEGVIETFRAKAITSDSVIELRAQLESLGLSTWLPSTLADIIQASEPLDEPQA
jgi:predicted ATPase